ncbi:MAG: alpha/beta fold hydrolase [Solirubrobacterales bacterium]|nr:alpha/beta fold hydrolase [Solirubrobacterales bacterium]MBV9714345.1 alpha/beta fold hydrolase [Solirubrobacterales bacterium]
MQHRIFELGDFPLQKGGAILPDAKIGYLALGELNQAKDNVVVCPTWFTATPSDTAMWLTGPNRALDPERWFIVIPNHFGAAVSSSPSNTPPPFDRGRFPHATTYDNIVAQHRLLTEGLGVERIRLVSSWSMGAAQSYAWGALHPEMVDAIAPISGSARTANFNKVFLTGNIRAITSDPDWRHGFYGEDPPIRGVRAMAAIYAGWGLSEPFYREEGFRAFGAGNVEEFIDYFWDAFFQKCDANDLLAQMWTWWHNDLGDHPSFGGDFAAALSAIQARTIIIQSETDSYFPPVDSEYEASRIPNGELRVIPTIWGHLAPFNPEDQAFIDDALRELLDA